MSVVGILALVSGLLSIVFRSGYAQDTIRLILRNEADLGMQKLVTQVTGAVGVVLGALLVFGVIEPERWGPAPSDTELLIRSIVFPSVLGFSGAWTFAKLRKWSEAALEADDRIMGVRLSHRTFLLIGRLGGGVLMIVAIMGATGILRLHL